MTLLTLSSHIEDGSGKTLCLVCGLNRSREPSKRRLKLTFDKLVDLSLVCPLAVHFVVLAFNHVLTICDLDTFKPVAASLRRVVDDLFAGHLLRQQRPHAHAHFDAFTVLGRFGRRSEGRHAVLRLGLLLVEGVVRLDGDHLVVGRLLLEAEAVVCSSVPVVVALARRSLHCACLN